MSHHNNTWECEWLLQEDHNDFWQLHFQGSGRYEYVLYLFPELTSLVGPIMLHPSQPLIASTDHDHKTVVQTDAAIQDAFVGQ